MKLETGTTGLLRFLTSLLGIILFNIALADDLSPIALERLKNLAEKGDVEAQFDYGLALTRQKSWDEGKKWIRKSADNGVGVAWYWLARHTNVDDDNLADYYIRAAKLGYDRAWYPAFEQTLFRAEDRADVVKAKKIADMFRAKKIKVVLINKELLDTVDRCHSAGKLKLPKQDMPTEKEKNDYARYVKQCFIFKRGLGVPRDMEKYRKCLYTQAQPKYSYNYLAEIYANGWGVPRQPMLALAFVCHASDVPAELNYQVTTLYNTRHEKQLKKEFKFCDHITSGRSIYECSGTEEKVATIKRKVKLDQLLANWSEQHKKEYQALALKAEKYWKSHAYDELDMSGTLAPTTAMNSVADARETFLADLVAFEKGKYSAKKGDYHALMKAINKNYQILMNKPHVVLFGTVSRDAVKVTQNSWLAYRDSYLELIKQRYPSIPHNDVMAQIATTRLAELKEIIHMSQYRD